MVDAGAIHRYLEHDLAVYVYDIIPSTNDEARRHLMAHPCERAVFIARGQTAGRGRRGRSFYSPAGTGIYMTYAFRSDGMGADTVRVTTAASVAVAKALDCGAQIKWVNDLYCAGRKVCGILAETVRAAERSYTMIGVGVNLTTTDFPEDIREKAGSIGRPLDKERTIAAICDNLSELADDPSATDYLGYYRDHMMGIGETIRYVENGQAHTAQIEGIGDRGELLVVEGTVHKRLRSGDITFTSFEAAGR